MKRPGAQSGVTLMEVLVAVSLLSLLAVGILTAMRVGLAALDKANKRVIDNRRVVGAERIIEQQFGALMPVKAQCVADPEKRGPPVPFFQGESDSMRFVSTYSLQEAWRGAPRLLEFRVIPGEQAGVRLVVNEVAHHGPDTAGQLCSGPVPDPVLGVAVLRFRPIEVGPASFVLADKLAFCRFLYLERKPPPLADVWRPSWVLPNYPAAVRIEMGPLEPDASRLRPMSITVAIHIQRAPDIDYVDYAQ